MKKLMIILMCVMLCACTSQGENTVVTTTAPVITTTSLVTTTAPEVTTTVTTTSTVVATTTKVTTTTPVATTTVTTTAKPVETGLIEVTSGDILNKIFNQETFIMYLGTSYCPHCVEYKPHIKDFLKDYTNVAIYYVVLDECDVSQTSELTTLVGLEYTPTTFLIVNGGTQDSFVGTNDDRLKEMISMLK